MTELMPTNLANRVLRLLKFHTVHTLCILFLEASDEGVDCSSDFQRIFQSLSFASFSELQTKIEEFQRVTGSLYARRNTKRFPVGSAESKSLVYRSFAYECYHYGSHKSGSMMQRNRRSAKIGCRSKIYVSCSRNMLKIVRYDVRHNHGVTPDEARLYPRNRRLTQSQLAVVEDLLETTQENNVVKEFIETNFDTSVTMSDVRNLRTKIKVSREQISHEFMISKLHPRLDELQCLTTSGNRSQFLRRLHCLTNLIEFWRNGVDVDIVPRSNSNDNVCGYEGANAGDPQSASTFGNTPTGRRVHDMQESPGTMRFNSFPENSTCEFDKEDDEYDLKAFDNRRLGFANLRNAWP
nr:unnamed protein product [Spirometra erinaceieuropaei]